VAVAAVALLVAASWLTTQEDWEGGYPSGVIRLHVRGPDGQAVPGASIRVYNADTGEQRDGYPFPEPRGVTDERGRLVLTKPHGGIEFGGHRWYLFWTIRMGDRAARFECEITAPGFRPARLRLWDLFENRTDEQVQVAWPGPENKVHLQVFEPVVTLDR